MLTNPCRPGSAKHLVCEAAFAGDSVEKTKSDLEHLRPGAGGHLDDCIRTSGLRTVSTFTFVKTRLCVTDDSSQNDETAQVTGPRSNPSHTCRLMRARFLSLI